jgi:hypothetical protein
MCFPNYAHWFVCMSTLGFEVPPRGPSYIANSVKMFWQTDNYSFDNMFNLHKMQCHTIEMQMDYQQDILMKVLMKMKVRVIKVWS